MNTPASTVPADAAGSHKAALERFATWLAAREAELSAMLSAPTLARPRHLPGDDPLARAAEALVRGLEAAQAEQAAIELEQVLAARHRLAEGRFGWCCDCGEVIDSERLDASPAAAFCRACQAVHEQQDPPVNRH